MVSEANLIKTSSEQFVFFGRPANASNHRSLSAIQSSMIGEIIIIRAPYQAGREGGPRAMGGGRTGVTPRFQLELAADGEVFGGAKLERRRRRRVGGLRRRYKKIVSSLPLLRICRLNTIHHRARTE